VQQLINVLALQPVSMIDLNQQGRRPGAQTRASATTMSSIQVVGRSPTYATMARTLSAGGNEIRVAIMIAVGGAMYRVGARRAEG